MKPHLRLNEPFLINHVPPETKQQPDLRSVDLDIHLQMCSGLHSSSVLKDINVQKVSISDIFSSL